MNVAYHGQNRTCCSYVAAYPRKDALTAVGRATLVPAAGRAVGNSSQGWVDEFL